MTDLMQLEVVLVREEHLLKDLKSINNDKEAKRFDFRGLDHVKELITYTKDNISKLNKEINSAD